MSETHIWPKNRNSFRKQIYTLIRNTAFTDYKYQKMFSRFSLLFKTKLLHIYFDFTDLSFTTVTYRRT